MDSTVQQIQLQRTMKLVNKRLDRIEAEINFIVVALKRKRMSSLDLGLKELSMGRVHRYKSVKSLAKDVWG